MNFFTSYGQLWPLCSYICIIRNQEPNEEIMDLCKKIIHERFGFLNYFRGNGEKVITTLLACESDPGAAADLCKEAYDILKDHFGSSNYLPMLAYYMATTIAPRDYAQFAQDSWNLYQHRDLFLYSKVTKSRRQEESKSFSDKRGVIFFLHDKTAKTYKGGYQAQGQQNAFEIIHKKPLYPF
jgi:hypothetical protein